jgi:hypothetical protein
MNELTRRRLTLVAIATFLFGTGAPLSVAAEDGQRTARVALEGGACPDFPETCHYCRK